MTYIPLISYFAAALVVSFLCSLLEATILSTSHSFIEKLVREKRRSGFLLQRFKQRIDRPLIAILTTNTVANMFGAAGVGAEASKIARRAGQEDTLWVGLASAALTFCILICSEIIPKTLGAAHWQVLAAPGAYFLRMLVFLLAPVIAALEFIPRRLVRPQTQADVSREEVAILAELAGRRGSLRRRENRVISNLLALTELRARDIMTPRVEVFAVPKGLTAREVAEAYTPIRYSRIPVYEENLDHIVGIALRYRIFEECFHGDGSKPIASMLARAHYVPESQTIDRLLDEFIEKRAHLFVVVNEYGGTEGIVTLEDAIETLLGVEIVDELDPVADLRLAAKQKLARRQRERQARQVRGESAWND